MGNEPMKIYEVLTDMVLVDGEGKEIAYEAGKKYEMTPTLAATAPEGALVEYVEPPIEPAPETKPAPTPAVPWAGNHKV